MEGFKSEIVTLHLVLPGKSVLGENLGGSQGSVTG